MFPGYFSIFRYVKTYQSTFHFGIFFINAEFANIIHWS